MINEFALLSNGYEIPIIGLGTANLIKENTSINPIEFAINQGYRLIDTASIYSNEECIGKAIKNSIVPRNNLFITTKLWNKDHGYKQTLKAFNESLKKLNLDYIDLYLIHWPNQLNSETWSVFEELYLQNKIKAIGVSNFKINHLEELFRYAKILPMVNEIEVHPYCTNKDLITYCTNRNIKIISWSPLMRGKIFEVDLLKKLSKKYNKTIPQLILKWHIQNNTIPIPKSSNQSRITENIDIFDFNIENLDLRKIDSLNMNHSILPVPGNTVY